MQALEALKDLLDTIPLGSVIALAGIVMVLYAYFTGSIDITQAFEYFGWLAGGSAAIGVMRTHAGKGV
jgi:hypothetical protein